jgi:hypothetical protein
MGFAPRVSCRLPAGRKVSSGNWVLHTYVSTHLTIWRAGVCRAALTPRVNPQFQSLSLVYLVASQVYYSLVQLGLFTRI